MTNTKDLHNLIQDKANQVRKLESLIDEVKQETPEQIAQRVGISLTTQENGQKQFSLPFLNKNISISTPAFDICDSTSGKSLSVFQKLLGMYYIAQSDGFPAEGRWISFSELPSGSFYTRAFEGYTGNELSKVFGNEGELFESACTELKGRRESLGNFSFAFEFIPNVWLLAACWLGDEEFPSSFKILFDASISHHMSTDGCAILGSMLTQKILAVARSKS